MGMNRSGILVLIGSMIVSALPADLACECTCHIKDKSCCVSVSPQCTHSLLSDNPLCIARIDTAERTGGPCGCYVSCSETLPEARIEPYIEETGYRSLTALEQAGPVTNAGLEAVSRYAAIEDHPYFNASVQARLCRLIC